MSEKSITKQDLENFKKEILNSQNQLFEDLKTHLEDVLQEQKIKAKRGLLKSFEVQEILGFSNGTMQNLRKNGTLPYSKIGGNIFYDYNDIMKLIDKNKRNKKI